MVGLFYNTALGYYVSTTDGTTTSTGQLVGDNFAQNAQTEVTFGWRPTTTKKWSAFQVDADVSPAGNSTSPFPTGFWANQSLSVSWVGHISRIAVARGGRTPAVMRVLKRSA